MQLHIISKISFVPVEHTWKNLKLYLFVLVFSIGNLVLPMSVHAIPNGGIIFQPLFFFTLVAAYSEGFLAGILVAIASPLINYLVTGMPPLLMLPSVLFKSLLVAGLASIVANRLKKISFIAITVIILAMQLFGGFFDYLISGNAAKTLDNMILGIPGMIIMIVGGYAVLRLIAKIRIVKSNF